MALSIIHTKPQLICQPWFLVLNTAEGQSTYSDYHLCRTGHISKKNLKFIVTAFHIHSLILTLQLYS